MSLKDKVRNKDPMGHEWFLAQDVEEAVLKFRERICLDNHKDGEWIELDSRIFKDIFKEIFGDWEQ